MIEFNNAREIILKNTTTLNGEKINFKDSLGRILYTDIKSPCDLPHYNRSAMDGYAVRSEDIKFASKINPVTLVIIDKVRAGYISEKKLKKNTAIRIMTGGLVPEGADTIVIQEDTKKKNNQVLIFNSIPIGKNICYKGEDIKKGKIVLPKNTLIKSSHVSLFAMLGITRVNVYKKPRVAILTTGDELIEVEEELKKGKVRNSNQYALYNQVKECDGIPFIIKKSKDNKKELLNKIKEGLDYDILLTSGGVSVGEYDLVGEIFKELGIKIFFQKIAVKPGKPTIFGKYKKVLVFGLPGNPVSTMISFYQLVRPIILKMQGNKNIELNKVEVILEEDIKLKQDRLKIIRMSIIEKNGKKYAKIPTHQGSGNLLSLAWSDCLIKIDAEKDFIPKGTILEAELIP